MSADDLGGPFRGAHLGNAERVAPAVAKPILVIDDDDAIREMVVTVLRQDGYTVREAANGEVGLREAQTELPALILLDLRMPKVDGWEFARCLREMGIAAPIVVMTAAHDARRSAESIGAVDQLAKPFHIDELLALVARHAFQTRD